MSLEACIQQAVAAGQLDQDRADKAIGRIRDLTDRYRADGLSPADAALRAGDDALESIVKEARTNRRATLRQLEQAVKNVQRYGTDKALNDPDLLARDLEKAERKFHHLRQEFMSSISGFLKEFHPNVVGQVRGRALLREVNMELHGEFSGNPAAKAMAQSVLAVQERSRVLFNTHGGDIGKLADRGIAHRHDANKIRAMGFDGWSAAIRDRLDWNRIIDHTTGKPFTATPGAMPNRAASDRLLRDIYDGIVSGDWDNRFPSFTDIGRKTAAKGGEHRVLHFKSGADWWDYNEAFGAANAFESIVQELSARARDIALMEAFGPNPRAGLLHASQVMIRAANLATDLTGKAHVKRIKRVEAKTKFALVMMDTMTGRNNRPQNEGWARFFAGTRNLLTAAQLGSAPLSSVTDWASMGLAAQAVGLNARSAWASSMKTMLSGVTPEMARDLGYIFDTWFDSNASAARFMGSIWAPELTSRITSAVMRVNGMAFLTDRSRFGVAMSFGSDLAGMAGKGFGDLPPQMQRWMQTHDITARDWDAIRDPAVIFTDPTGGKHVSAAWFRRHTSLPEAEAEDIALRWGAMVQAFQELAIPSASLRGRAAVIGEAKPGSIGGELLNSTFMYKSFIASLMFNQLRLIGQMDGGMNNRAWYVAKYIGAMTLAGSLAVQLKEIAKGRDPRPMDDPKFWGAAMLQGGGVGIFGDFFSATSSRSGGGLAETLAGPVGGLIGDMGRMVSSNAQRAAEGKAPLVGRDVANFARRYTPGSTLWYTRLALDRLVWDQLQKVLDPEAENLWRRQERQARKDYGTSSWWMRGRTSPDRAPNLTNIGGNQ